MLPLPSAWASETGLSIEAGILELWDKKTQSLVGQARTQFVISHPMWAKGTNINLRVLYKSLLLHREAKVWVEAEGRAHRLSLQGFKGVSTPSHHRLSQLISRLYRVCFYYLASGLRYCLIRVHRIHVY